MRRLTIALATAGAVGAATLAAPAAALAVPGAAAEPDYWSRVLNWRSQKCLEQSWENGSEQPDIRVATCTGAENQQWTYTRVGSSYTIATVRNKKSGKCLEQVYVNGVEQPDVKAAVCTGSLNQQWRTAQAEWYVTGYFMENVSSGKELQQSYLNNTQQSVVNVAETNPWSDYRNQVWRQ